MKLIKSVDSGFIVYAVTGQIKIRDARRFAQEVDRDISGRPIQIIVNFTGAALTEDELQIMFRPLKELMRQGGYVGIVPRPPLSHGGQNRFSSVKQAVKQFNRWKKQGNWPRTI